jgi:hypothetical protein
MRIVIKEIDTNSKEDWLLQSLVIQEIGQAVAADQSAIQ